MVGWLVGLFDGVKRMNYTVSVLEEHRVEISRLVQGNPCVTNFPTNLVTKVTMIANDVL